APGPWQSTGAGLPTPRVGALRDGPDGALWAGTSGGAARLRPGSSAWEPHLSDGPLVNGTQRAVVDPRGVWFTTGNDFPAGIARGVVLHFDGVSWSALTSATTCGAFEQADAFGSLSDATGRIWIGHCCANAEPRPRIDRYDPGTGIWDQPPAYNILTFAQSPVSGQVLAGSSEHENGVYVFDAVSGALLDSLTPANSGIRSNNLRSVRFDSAGKGWFGTAFNGLDVWDGRGTTLHADDLWTHYVAQPDNQVTSIAVIDPATAWIGTALGAGRIQSGTFTRLLTVAPSEGGPGLPSAQVNDLTLDTNGSVWIGTSAGLARADVSGFGPIEVFTTAQGLVDDDIRALAWDAARGVLWVGTVHGVSRVVPAGTGAPAITDRVYVYPNPSRAGSLRIGGIQNSLTGEVRDVSGNLVHRFRCDPAQNEIWDLRAESGEPAPAGVYLIVLHDKRGSKTLRAARAPPRLRAARRKPLDAALRDDLVSGIGAGDSRVPSAVGELHARASPVGGFRDRGQGISSFGPPSRAAGRGKRPHHPRRLGGRGRADLLRSRVAHGAAARRESQALFPLRENPPRAGAPGARA